MGINGFSKVFGAGDNVELDDVIHEDSTVSIDMSIFIQTNLYATECDIIDTMRNIRLMIESIQRCRPKSIVAVFDNKSLNPRKAKTAEKRKVDKQKKKVRAENGELVNYVSSEIIISTTLLAKQMVLMMGIDAHTPPREYEAEHYASLIAETVISNDSDCMFFGAVEMLTKKGGVWRCYNLENILVTYDISMEDFRRICVALGTDFCKKVPGVGVKTVRNLKFDIDDEQRNIIEYASIGVIEPEIVEIGAIDVEGLDKLFQSLQ